MQTMSRTSGPHERRLALAVQLRALRDQSTALEVGLVARFERFALLQAERQSLLAEEQLLKEDGASDSVVAIIRRQEQLVLQESGTAGREMVCLVQEWRRVQAERMAALAEYRRLLLNRQNRRTRPATRGLAWE